MISVVFALIFGTGCGLGQVEVDSLFEQASGFLQSGDAIQKSPERNASSCRY